MGGLLTQLFSLEKGIHDLDSVFSRKANHPNGSYAGRRGQGYDGIGKIGTGVGHILRLKWERVKVKVKQKLSKPFRLRKFGSTGRFLSPSTKIHPFTFFVLLPGQKLET
jgi:hypothetical protein